MNAEDPKDTRDFLRRMPQGKFGRVIARIIYILTLLIFSFAVKIIYKYLLIEGYDLISGGTLGTEIVVFLAFLSYFLIQLIAFYKSSFHFAQNLGFLACAVIFILALIAKYTNISLSLPNINIASVIVIFALLAAGLIFGIIKAENSRPA